MPQQEQSYTDAGRRVETSRLIGYYIRDIAPVVPDLEVPVRIGELRSADMGGGTVAWTIALTGYDVAEMLEEAGEQLFARNLRRDLGDKVKVNAAIENTIRSEPEAFWYLNGGCSGSTKKSSDKAKEGPLSTAARPAAPCSRQHADGP